MPVPEPHYPPAKLDCLVVIHDICSEPVARQAQTLEWAWLIYLPKNLVNGNEAH